MKKLALAIFTNLLLESCGNLTTVRPHRDNMAARSNVDMVNFIKVGDPENTIRCRGVLAGRFVITARHCADWLASVPFSSTYLFFRGQKFTYSASEFRERMAKIPPANAGEALSLDFALLPVPSQYVGRAAITDPVSSALISHGQFITLADSSDREQRCRVINNCGAEIEIGCAFAITPGMSGSPLSADIGGQRQSIATLTQGYPVIGQLAYSYVGVGTLHSTIMGRSREFSEQWNNSRTNRKFQCKEALADEGSCALQAEFARQPKYRYSTDEGTFCRSSVAKRNGNLINSKRINDDRTFVAAVALSDEVGAAVDRVTKSICSFDADSMETLRCVSLPPSSSGRARALSRISDTSVAITDDDSGIAIINYDPATGLFLPQTYNRVLTPLKQVIAAVSIGRDRILVGGEGGTCVLEAQTCTKIVRFTENPRESEWTVRDFIMSPSGILLGLGRDFTETHQSFARCARFKVEGSAVEQLSWCPYPRSTKELGQLSIGLNVRGNLIALAQNGEAVSLDGDKIGKRIPVDGLYESLRPSTSIDDAPRAAGYNENDLVTLASSDGSVRILKVISCNGTIKKIVASDRTTAFDLSIWIVSMASFKGRALAVAQSGEMYALRWDSENLSSAYPGPNSGICH